MNNKNLQTITSFFQSYLVALAPLGFLWLHNWTDVFFPEVVLWATILCVVTITLFSIFSFVTTPKNPQKVEILTNTALFFLLYFGYICSYESWWFQGLYKRGLISLKILIPLWVMLGAISIKSILVYEKYNQAILALQRRFTYAIYLLLACNFFFIIARQQEKSPFFEIETFQKKPNVYYIILDAYPRQDTLKEVYNYDNEPFLEQLEKLGFTVCRKSCSNYPITQQSIPSTLSMNYLPYDTKNLKTIFYSINSMFRNNTVFAAFKNNGYTILNISGNTYFTANHPAAINISSNYINTTLFSFTFIDKTIIGPFWAKFYKGNPCGANLINQLIYMKKAFEYPSPKFVFLHILSPHEPFSLNRNGLLREKNDPDLFSPKGHLESIEGISKRILVFIKEIKAKEPNSIIILQSDHGSDIIHIKKYNTISNLPPGILKERMGILNSFYFPEELNSPTIPQTLTSVNTFRFVFSVLGDKIPPLEEKIFFSPFNRPWGTSTAQVLTPEEINNSNFIT